MREEKNSTRLSFDGELTVAHATVLKREIVESLQTGDNIELDIDQATKVDLSFLQLICSAHRTMCKDGKVLTLKKPFDPLFLQAIQEAGFDRIKNCRFHTTGECLFVEGGAK